MVSCSENTLTTLVHLSEFICEIFSGIIIFYLWFKDAWLHQSTTWWYTFIIPSIFIISFILATHSGVHELLLLLNWGITLVGLWRPI